MVFTVDSDSQIELTLGETDPVKSVLQNVYLILKTRKNTVPMYRDFGLPMAFLSKPLFAAETILTAEISEALEAYEPRAELLDVSFLPSAFGGKISVNVEVTI